jgi:hypothetical protein
MGILSVRGRPDGFYHRPAEKQMARLSNEPPEKRWVSGVN